MRIYAASLFCLLLLVGNAGGQNQAAQGETLVATLSLNFEAVAIVSSERRRYIPALASSQPASELIPVVFVLNDNDHLALQQLRARVAMRTIWKQTIVAGRQANVDFLLGGEFPVPVMTYDAVQRTRAAATVQFKEYGVSVRLRINDTDDAQRLAVELTPQISTVDLTRKVRFEEYIIPALVSRRTTKKLIISPGETIALVDLLTQEELSSLSRVGFGLSGKSAFSELRKFARETGQQLDLMLLVTPDLHSESLTRSTNDLDQPSERETRTSVPGIIGESGFATSVKDAREP